MGALDARMTRSALWGWSLPTGAALAAILACLPPPTAWAGLSEIGHVPLGVAAALIALLPFTALVLLLAVGRLHDIERTGWWAMVFPMLAAGVVLLWPAGAGLAFPAVASWLTLLLTPGTIGPNSYGPDPRGWESLDHFDRQQRELAEDQRLARLGVRRF